MNNYDTVEGLKALLPRFFEDLIPSFVENYVRGSIFTFGEIEEIKKKLEDAAADDRIIDLVYGDITAIFTNDPSLRTKKDKREVFFQQGLKMRFFHSVAHRFYKEGKTLFGRAISEGVKSLTGIEVHPGAIIGKRLTLDHGVGIVIGETAEIGNDVIMFHCVTLGGIGGTSVKRHPTIGNNVLIGAHAQVLGAIYVGDNAKIGANSTVLRDVEANTTVAGKLAEVKRKRNIGE
jgi:serine O-acetyltransferase